jgi:dTDP-4-dehydrorhamnose 3,5-epimerase
VRVVNGEIFDVAVDLRRRSSTFGQWTGAILSAENKRQLWIPSGFAHGFYALSETVDLIYKVTDYYAPEWDRTLLWNDPQINIAWPLVDGQPPVLSAKDLQGRLFAQADVFEE